jgi:glycosyltransferase involved in cell wall biosynthesis
MLTRLLALTDPGCAVSTRYRIQQFVPYLQAEGVFVEIREWPRPRSAQSALMDDISSADAVLFQRALPNPLQILQIRRRARRLVYDFDDAIIFVESTRCKPRRRLARWLSFHTMVRLADAVTAGNSYLANLVTGRGKRNPARIVPTTLELGRYTANCRTSPPLSVLGWIGGRWTLPYLEQIKDALEAAHARTPQLSIKIIADQASTFGKLPVELIPWSETTEVQSLKQLGIGLAPLPDDAWTRGKCALRLLQYLAAGVPAVASPVGTQADIIGDGAALAARTGPDWYDRINDLMAAPAMTASLVERGRCLVSEKFSTKTWFPHIRESWCGGAP